MVLYNHSMCQTRMGQGVLESTNVADGEMRQVISMLLFSSFVSKCFDTRIIGTLNSDKWTDKHDSAQKST